MSDYQTLVSTLKALTQGEEPNTVTLPMAENEWNTRPQGSDYGIVRPDFEAGQFYGNDRKLDTAYEGSVDLFSHAKDGGGWVKAITDALESCCDGCWSLNSHVWERDTGLFHWEWTFEVMG